MTQLAKVAKAKTKEPVYSIPAVRGIQAGREYYVAMLQVGMLAKLFPDLRDLSNHSLAVQERCQRQIDPSRAKKIADYVLAGTLDGDTYTLSSVAASVKCHKLEGMEFIPYEGLDIGTLNIVLSSEFCLFDGQHRVRGLILAAQEDEDLKDETISIVLYHHISLLRDQQAFADMNRNVKVPSASLSIVYDHRSEDSALTLAVLEKCGIMKSLIDFERTGCGGKNPKLFPLQGFHRATKMLLEKSVLDKTEPNRDADIEYAAWWWGKVCQNVGVFRRVFEQTLSAKEARENSISATQLTLECLAIQGQRERSFDEQCREAALDRLVEFDWLKSNPLIQENCMKNNRIVKNSDTIEALRILIFAG